MRDAFSAAVKRALARRVGYVCSNPQCRALTVGPGVHVADVVNVGVAAHIAAASAGGPRYDATMTPIERSAVTNGIWLCQTCAKLIDSDSQRYTVVVLAQWKSTTEQRTTQLLQSKVGSVNAPLELIIPSSEDPDAILSFADLSVQCVGRANELLELRSFLEADDNFSWWTWVGAAGSGKSRLAVEFCRSLEPSWHVGFLRDSAQARLLDYSPLQPTFIVVDYAAARSAWLSEAIATLSQREMAEPVRLLVIERAAAGQWWQRVQRLDRYEESRLVAASAYALPKEMPSLNLREVRDLIVRVGTVLNASLSPTDVEDVIDHAERIDPSRRPLFVQIATLDWLDRRGLGSGREESLRRLIDRAEAHVADLLPSLDEQVSARRVRLLATALGGLTTTSYARLIDAAAPPAGLLPTSFASFEGVTLESQLEGVTPDIVGEQFVLDQLLPSGGEATVTGLLLNLACAARPDAYWAFVERAIGDHPEHPGVLELFRSVDGALPEVEILEAAVNVIPLLRRSDHPALEWIFDGLAALQAIEAHPRSENLVATALFRHATLFYSEKDWISARRLYSRSLDMSEPSALVHAQALNNRGLTLCQLGHSDEGMADFTRVIEEPAADDEARACALNNRADLFEAGNRLDLAIADRSRVIALRETTFDRRYIALIRRARAFRRLSEHNRALRDLESIMQTEISPPSRRCRHD